MTVAKRRGAILGLFERNLADCKGRSLVPALRLEAAEVSIPLPNFEGKRPDTHAKVLISHKPDCESY